ncbi:MAG: hypothetical protein WCJ61_08955, partial [Paludibacter sp.]
MKVFWTKFALDSLKEIFTYYKDNVSVTIANNIKNSILLSTRQLEFQPQSVILLGLFILVFFLFESK